MCNMGPEIESFTHQRKIQNIGNTISQTDKQLARLHKNSKKHIYEQHGLHNILDPVVMNRQCKYPVYCLVATTSGFIQVACSRCTLYSYIFIRKFPSIFEKPQNYVRPPAMQISNLALIKLIKVLKNNLAKKDIFVISGYGRIMAQLFSLSYSDVVSFRDIRGHLGTIPSIVTFYICACRRRRQQQGHPSESRGIKIGPTCRRKRQKNKFPC